MFSCTSGEHSAYSSPSVTNLMRLPDRIPLDFTRQHKPLSPHAMAPYRRSLPHRQCCQCPSRLQPAGMDKGDGSS
jgi:hypothetical protein